MRNITETFVTYHECGNCYIDGKNEIVPKVDVVLIQHLIHFGKT